MNQKEIMQSMLEYWKKNQTFKKSIEQRPNNFQAITYDGPPFASGTPHFGHGLVSTMKDTIGRYKTMKGYKIIRDWGWDCHGLPVEKAVEKKLGLDGKKDIEEKLGIQKFTEECRKYVSNVSSEWENFVDNIGRWADMDNAYKTMDLDFMESVMNVFWNMYNQNLVYKGFKIQRYCPSCATSLANNEVNEGYQDRQDPAITVKFPLNLVKKQSEINSIQEHCKDGATKATRCIIKNGEGKVLMSFMPKYNEYLFPGGKVDKGENIEKSIIREVKEETGIELKEVNFIGTTKCLYKTGLRLESFFEAETDQEPQDIETDSQTGRMRIDTEKSDNELGWAINVQGTIIDDIDDIIREFHNLYLYKSNIIKDIHELNHKIENILINALAWTTTPWTLPSNSFLAVGKDIFYSLVFDKDSKEYYLLADKLLKKYYKNSNDYILVNKIKGSVLEGVVYNPLFEYINQSSIKPEFKEKYFQIITGDFVSTEDGTGIVHIAPSFGEDDFNIVADKLLPRDQAKDWLFLPVNDYGEFNNLVSDYEGVRVYDANKDIIKGLKDDNKLILQQSYNHSYPHCWRCNTALISKAMDSRFIKEPSLKPATLDNAKKIGFVPQAIQKRFVDTLDSAPDWNLARNRYWGSPLPIWENIENNEDRIVPSCLEDIYQWTKKGSANITKNIFVRHGRTDYNMTKKQDSRGDAVLNDLGLKQAQTLINTIDAGDDFVVVISPLKRCWQTIKPYLESKFGNEVEQMEKKYFEISSSYEKIFDEGEVINYNNDDSKQKVFKITDNVFVDFRYAEVYIPEKQGKEFDCHHTVLSDIDKPLYPKSESIQQVHDRVKKAVLEHNTKHKTKTIISIGHGDSVVAMLKALRDFDYRKQKYYYYPENRDLEIYSPQTFYFDNTKESEADLHRPYVDNYDFDIDGKKYKRIPEVMDCWFESGSMPFGQVGYIKTDKIEKSRKPLIYPADFIIEGLDQTRGWFRTLHVVGNAVKGENSFNNVIINGLVLAEDGKKMSKSLNNYPDPDYLFGRYGTDSYRLYMLSSPSVRAEPMKFSEKGVDQVYKDFTSALTNAFNFFKTYANIDNYKNNNSNLYFLRHSNATGVEFDDQLTQEGLDKMENQTFIENILRLNLDKIYVSPAKRTLQTKGKVMELLERYNSHHNIEVIEDERLWQENKAKAMSAVEEIQKNNVGKNILIISHVPTFTVIWNELYGEENAIDKAEIVKLPNSKIANELDKWILAELHKMGLELEKAMDGYQLDIATKALLGFMDNLTNWYIRRSRRRFRATGMTEDKLSAYNTLFEVLSTYCKMAAPFAPFISEHIYLDLMNSFQSTQTEEGISIHLKHFPLSSELYINQDLLNEIHKVRKIISLGLFIRAKNNAKIKQPLKSIEIKL